MTTITTASITIATIAEKAQKALLKQAQDNKKLMEEITASAASLDTLISALKAEHAVDTANISADLKAAHMQISFLQRQVVDLQAQVEADRTARVEIAKAESGRQGVVVNTNGK